MKIVHFTVFGQLYSQKNSHILARGRTIKHPKAKQFERDFLLQVPREYRKLALGSKNRSICARIMVLYPSFRQDLDCSLVYDLLQKAGVVANDRFIREKHEYAEIDRKNPRVKIWLQEMGRLVVSY